jgi:hypothetical protein
MPRSRRETKRVATVTEGLGISLHSPEPTTAMPSRPNDNSTRKQTETQGLTLDDYVHAAANMRQVFKLAKPSFSLRNVESQAGASAAVQAIVDATIERQGSEIYAKRHGLLDTLGRQVYGEWTQSPIYSGHRIDQGSIERVLRKTIEIGLQIAVQLPTKDEQQVRPPNLSALGAGLERLAGKLEATLEHEHFRARMRIFNELNSVGADSLQKLTGELRRGADMITAMAKLKVKRVLSDTRNPQIRWALYFIQWVASSTGRQRYSDITELFNAAFIAAGKRTPPWVERLPVEMTFKRNRRKAWVRTISK